MAAPIVYCKCGKKTKIRTSWRDPNPSRRFYGCSGFNIIPIQLRLIVVFSLWYDPPICKRASDVIPGLLRRVNRLEVENKQFETGLKSRAQSRILATRLIVELVLVMAILLTKFGDNEKEAIVLELGM
ncbi:hypothetical protein ACH5RR_016476 [Cinchona calisaya]|uniref:Zinc finger GRF-type domain-containing protein n=1 Tax=Cinchona calisaya TaxID=153742 RepID=A0ABD2ZYR3_9GENT